LAISFRGEVAKQAINDKLQGSVATYIRCGEYYQIKKFIAESVSENFFLKSVNIIVKYFTTYVCDSHLFSDIIVSQCSGATRIWCGGIFNYYFAASLLENLVVKELGESVKIR